VVDSIFDVDKKFFEMEDENNYSPENVTINALNEKCPYINLENLF